MSPNQRQRIDARGPSGDARGRPIRAQVAATSMDALPGYVPPVQDPTLQGLIDGLSKFNPALAKMDEDAKDAAAQRGAMDRLGSQDKRESSAAYINEWSHFDGLIKGQQDASSLRQAYDTEFDKDRGDLEQFIRDKYGALTNGFQAEDPFLKGYDKALAPVLQDIRKSHTDYRKNAVESRVESNAMQLLDGGVRAYTSTGQPVPPEYVESIRGYLGGNFGVSSSRFDQLLFESVKRIGDEGNFSVYDSLKQNKPDGSPGTYYDPAWKAKIDAAQVHSQNVFLEKQTKADTLAKRQREEKQETALYDVFSQLYDGDAEGAKTKFDGLVKQGLFTRASDLIKWQDQFAKSQQKDARADQQATETEMLTRIYTGRAGIRDVIDADMTPQQKKGLLSEIRRVQQENRMAAAAEDKAEKAIYKSPEYKSGMDYIKGTMVSQPNALDPFGTGTIFDRQQRAAAELEFTRRASLTKDPAELNTVREEIVGRYLKRRKELADADKTLPGAGQLRYSSPAEAADAARKGLLSLDELAIHHNFFKAQRMGRTK